ncbi:MAG: sodium-dependent transporter [Desulfobacterales bacterium]|nr:sodium-dependent transporter [Desulfobacterales bacterium]
MTSVSQRDSFTGKYGFIAAAAGSAIGLGNIWKFPYITGVYGGSAFIIVYLICILLIGMPVMLSEITVGRRAQKGVFGAYKNLAPGTPWFFSGYMGIAAAFLILSFYGVVAGWTMEYVVKAVTGAFNGRTPDEIGAMFGGFIGQTAKPILWQIGFMSLTCFIVIAGIKNGIERYSKILMPVLLVILFFLCARSVTLDGASKGFEFLFKPDFTKLSAEAVLAALGHAFFSLSLGMGTLVTYGSYVKKNESLGPLAVHITAADTIIALLAGIAIFPAVFAFGIEPAAGPGLVFVTLPNVFQQMPLGSFFCVLFFFLLAIAALTSSISILEVVVTHLVEDFKVSRKTATIVTTLVITLFGIPCSLSFGVMSEFKILGANFFDNVDHIASNFLLPLGGLCISLFVGWKMARKDVEDELSNGGTVCTGYLNIFLFLANIVAPIAITAVFLHGLKII